MGGETKKRISDLECELNELRRKNKWLQSMWSKTPTIRDYFAMSAMTGIITRSAAHFDSRSFNLFSNYAYEIADAMLEARKNG